MVPNWHTVITDPRNYVKWILDMKTRHPPDTMWYAPASALPSNVATLIASGFDLFDYSWNRGPEGDLAGNILQP